MVTILMMPAKAATLGLLKKGVSWNKGYEVIIYVSDQPKSGNSSISIREAIIISILYGFDHKNCLFRGVVLIKDQ